MNSAQQGVESLPDIVHDAWLRGSVRMQVVCLKLFRRHAFQQKGQQADPVRFRQSGENILKLCDVGSTIIGRQFHACQQRLGVDMLDLQDHLVQIAFDVRRAEAAQAVVCAEFHDDDGRAILFQQSGKALSSAQRGLAADAGIDDFEPGATATAIQFLL